MATDNAAGSKPASTLDASAIAAELKSLDTSKKGLTGADAASRLARYGRNAIVAKTESRWKKLAAYFWGPLPWMIEAAALISLVRQDWSDFAVVAGLLSYEHSLVRPGDLRRLDAAFFTMNGVISVTFFAFVLADVLVS